MCLKLKNRISNYPYFIKLITAYNKNEYLDMIPKQIELLQQKSKNSSCLKNIEKYWNRNFIQNVQIWTHTVNGGFKIMT